MKSSNVSTVSSRATGLARGIYLALRGLPTVRHRWRRLHHLCRDAPDCPVNIQDDRADGQAPSGRRHSREGNCLASFYYVQSADSLVSIQRVDKIFKNMDRDKDAKLTYDEFVEGSKQDPTIVQVRTSERPLEVLNSTRRSRLSHYMTALYDSLRVVASPSRRYPSTLPALSYFEWRAFAKFLVCIGKFLPVTCFHACIVTHSCGRTVFPRNLSFVSVV